MSYPCAHALKKSSETENVNKKNFLSVEAVRSECVLLPILREIKLLASRACCNQHFLLYPLLYSVCDAYLEKKIALNGLAMVLTFSRLANQSAIFQRGTGETIH